MSEIIVPAGLYFADALVAVAFKNDIVLVRERDSFYGSSESVLPFNPKTLEYPFSFTVLLAEEKIKESKRFFGGVKIETLYEAFCEVEIDVSSGGALERKVSVFGETEEIFSKVKKILDDNAFSGILYAKNPIVLKRRSVKVFTKFKY